MKKFLILILLIINNVLFTTTPKNKNDSFPAILIDTNLVLVNKHHFLLKNYIPSDLVNAQDYPNINVFTNIQVKREVLTQYQLMIDELSLTNLYIYSAYRTYERQKILYEYYNDDKYSARPGYSEHQTGLAIDIATLDTGLTDYFAQTDEYKLLIHHCYKYGFILRYPKGKEEITEYNYEAWHFRYVGIKHATFIMTNELTLEEYVYSNFY